jgi:heme-degrading monooxygenase HmoA
MVYEVRFQTVDPARRDEYVERYSRAIQEIKEHGARSVQVLCSEDDPAAVLVLVEWESKEQHIVWRDTPARARFREAVEGSGLQTRPSEGGYYVGGAV